MIENELREKVIEGLEKAIQHYERYSGDEYGREYDYARVGVDVLEDALELLKGQPTKFEIKHAISNTDIPKGMDTLDYMELMSSMYTALAKLYGEEPTIYMQNVRGRKND